ncbi:D-aminoacyl-tRNA deacylase [Thalassospiraceae bacterium LMO-JJ14]|nr:D-aminoacyl-tRNA deacylase [Thalassospiraceae bacterium LMO-JJ14]
MKAVLQRVLEASVKVDGETVGEIANGIVILFCAERGDSDADAIQFAHKAAKLRIFSDENGKTNLDINEVKGKILAISQFTLAAQWRKGNRPGFSAAETPERAKQLYELYCDTLREDGIAVETGIFAAEMRVALINDGPFTLVMDSRD